MILKLLSSQLAVRRARLCALLALIHACSLGVCAEKPQPPAFTNPSWPGAELFQDGKLTQIQIAIKADELSQLRKDPRQFVRATLTEAGVTYPDVGVRLKGSVGSFRPLDDKPALTIDFGEFGFGQRFHGLRRIHLNNSVEDPSYCREQLGGELFRGAGIPAPRATRARVRLNGRDLGLYVLKEGFTENFLECYFAKIGGNLFEPGEGHDVNEQLKRNSVLAPHGDRTALHDLYRAVAEKDPDLRWRKLQETLEVGRFVNFMALEVMLGHRDGYCLARNNFRVYEDLDTARMVFFPHGMDQLFGTVQLPLKPHMAGLVAKAVVETPEGEKQYAAALNRLFAGLLSPEALTNRITTMIQPLQGSLDNSDFEKIQSEAAVLEARIAERYTFLKRELSRANPASVAFSNGVFALSGWRKVDSPAGGTMEECELPGGLSCLGIEVNSDASPSWRTAAWLEPGSYNFRAKVRVKDVIPLSFGAHQGAGVRVTGQSRQSADLVGTSDWQVVSADFAIEGNAREVEFVCEVRAHKGQVWFDKASLQVIKTPSHVEH